MFLSFRELFLHAQVTALQFTVLAGKFLEDGGKVGESEREEDKIKLLQGIDW